MKYCPNCGKEVNEGADVCLSCGKSLNNKQTAVNPDGKSKIVAGLLALFFGTLGVHNFYLGYNGKAIAQLILTIVGSLTFIFFVGIFIVSAVGIWTFIEAILIFTGSINKDAKGQPLV